MARSAKPDRQIEAVLKRLDALAERAPDLAEPIAFYRAVLPILHEAQAAVEPFTIPPETAQRKLETGQPLLVGEDLPLEVEVTRALFLRLCRTIESLKIPADKKEQRHRSSWPLFSRGQPDSLALMERAHTGDGAALRSAAAEQIRRAVEKNNLDLPSVWAALAVGDERRLELLATGVQLDPELLRLLAQNSLKPALRVWAQALSHQVDLAVWRRGQCPFCGSPPVLAEIQGKEGERRLRCGACGADWPYPRFRCAFCTNSDYKALGYLTVEGEEEKYNLQTCQQCRGYLKVMVTFDPTPVDLLPVEDLATLHLDLIAAEHEYGRVPVR